MAIKRAVECKDVATSIEYTLQELTSDSSRFSLSKSVYGAAQMVHEHCRSKITNDSNSRLSIPNSLGCKKVKYNITYNKPNCSPYDTSCDDVMFNCDDVDSTVNECLYDDVEIEECASAFRKFSPDEICGSDKIMKEQALLTWQDLAKEVLMKYNATLTKLLVNMPGSYYDGLESSLLKPKELKLFKQGTDGGVIPQPIGMNTVNLEFEKQIGRPVKPVLISGNDMFWHYDHSANLFKGNVNGADITKGSSGLNIYFDRGISAALDKQNNVLAKDMVIAFVPGTIHLLEHYLFKTQQTKIVGGKRISYAPHTVIAKENIWRQVVDLAPFLGINDGSFKLETDMQIQVRMCDSLIPEVIVRAKKLFGLYSLPSQAYCGEGYNNVAAFLAACAPYTCTEVLC